MTDEIHKLNLKKSGGANTSCGLNIVALYPTNWYAMTDEAGKANVRVTLSEAKGSVTCKGCKERMKNE